MTKVNRILTIALGLFLISAGIAKFTTGHVFQYIEYQSGVDVFYPYVNHLTGTAEVIAGAAILMRRTRLLGSTMAAGLMIGAIAFHLSPWLGVAIPTGFSDGAAAPWTAADFSVDTTSMSFILAIVTGFRSIVIARNEYRERTTEGNEAVIEVPAAAASGLVRS